MFRREFSLAFFLIWAGIAVPVIFAIWAVQGALPSLWFRMTVSVLAGAAAMPVENELARRYGQRPQSRRRAHAAPRPAKTERTEA